MAIAITLREYLDQQGVDYDVTSHHHSSSSLETARAAGIPEEQLVKAVIFRDERNHYLMAILPSRCHAELAVLNALTHHNLKLAEEEELAELFDDCELGAVPPVGRAYALPTVWEEQLQDEEDIYLEAGDHEHLIHLHQEDFTRLMGEASHGHFSVPD